MTKIQHDTRKMENTAMKKHVTTITTFIAKTFLIFCLLAALPVFSYADTEVSGNITQNTTWTLAGSPYIVTGDIIVGQSGDIAVLTIEPGVEVKFNADTALTIGASNRQGALKAQGNADNRIIFTSNSETPAPGDWNHISFTIDSDSSQNILEHCVVEYGGGTDYSDGNLYFSNVSGTIKNCEIKNSLRHGIYVGESSSPVIADCTITNNHRTGIYCHSVSSSPEVTGNTISDNREFALRLNSNTDLNISDNTVTANLYNGIGLYADHITQSTVWHNLGLPYIITRNTPVHKPSRSEDEEANNSDPVVLTIQPGVEIQFNDAGISLGQIMDRPTNPYLPGNLVAQGTPDNPIKFTAWESPGGRVNWGGLNFTVTDENQILEHCIIEYGGGSYAGANINLYRGTGTIKNCEIRNSNSNGLSIDGSASYSILDCTITNNSKHGLYIGNTAEPGSSISNCTISNNTESGIFFGGGCSIIAITNNTISSNQEYAIEAGACLLADLSGNTFTDNQYNNVCLRGGYVTKDVVYKKLEQPYLLNGNIRLFSNYDETVTLTIEPGVKLNCFPGSSIQTGKNSISRGALSARGTADNPIEFTAYEGGGEGPLSWDGITFTQYTDKDATILEHCIIKNSGENGFAALYFQNGAGTVRNCEITDNTNNGIEIYGDKSPVISGCTISNNTKNGIYSRHEATPEISNNTISDNQWNAITVYPNAVGGVSGNTGTGNGHNIIRVPSGDITEHAVWHKQDLPYVVTGNIKVYKTGGTAVLAIEPGVELKFNSGINLTIGSASDALGALSAQGTTDNPILFTSNQETAQSGDWDGIVFSNHTDDAFSVIEHCKIEYSGGNTNQAGLYISDASPIVQYNTIRRSSTNGIRVSGAGAGSASINCNNIEENHTGILFQSSNPPAPARNNFRNNTHYGVNNTAAATVTAVNNWWNNINGPDAGDEANGNMIVDPWLTEESTCITDEPTNLAPFAPFNPSPADTEVNLLLTDGGLGVSWSCLDPNLWDTLTYDVYFGSSESDLELVGQDITDTNFTFTGLEKGHQYFWKIVAKDTDSHSVSSPVWWFITQEDPDLTVGQITWEPESGIEAKQQVTLKARIDNSSNGVCAEPFKVLFRVNGSHLASVEVDEILLIGATHEVSTTWTAELGDSEIEVVVDSENSILETNETNNSLTDTILGVTDPSPPELVSTTPADQSIHKDIDQVTFTLRDHHDIVDDQAVLNSILVNNSSGQTVSGTATEENDVFAFEITSSQLDDDTYTVSFTAQDPSGNTQDHSFSFTIDNVAPAAPTITGGTVYTGTIQVRPFQNISSNSDITLTGTREDNTRYVISHASTMMNEIQNILYVGSNQRHTTIQDAIDNAQDGDLIVIEPGTYHEEVLLNKWVHIKGMSTNPDEIIIKGTSESSVGVSFKVALPYPTPLSTPLYIEGLRIEPQSSNKTGLQLPSGTAGGTGSIIFNRCRFISPHYAYTVSSFGYPDATDMNVKFQNCYFQRGYSHFRYMNSENWTLEKCRFNNTYACNQCQSTPLESDYVTTSTQGYGSNYGSWMFGVLTIAQEYGSGDWSVVLSLPQGDNVIEVWLEDRAGNRGDSVWVDMTIDTIPPEITGTTPADGSFTNTAPDTIEIEFLEESTSLDLDNCLLSVKDQAFANVPGTWAEQGGDKIIFTPDQSLDADYEVYQLEIQLIDTVGNQAQARTSHFTMDKIAPEPPVLDPVPDESPSETFTITGTKEGYAAVWLNGEQVVDNTSETTWECTTTLSSGPNTLEFKAIDRAGNESDIVTAQIAYNDIRPTPIENLSINPDGDGMSVRLDWTGYDESDHGDINKYKIYVQTANFSSIAGLTPHSEVPSGTFQANISGLARNTTHWFAVAAEDNAGNIREEVTPVSAVPNDIIPPENPTNLDVQCFENKLIITWQHSANTGGDLANYKIYINDDTTGILVPAAENQYEKTELAAASAHDFKITCIDASNNESTGKTIQGITLLENPVNFTATPYSGYVKLTWDAVVPAEYLRHYKVYMSESPFSNIEGMTAIRTTSSLTVNITGLTNNTTYYFAVTSVNLSNGEQKAVNAAESTPVSDSSGPEMTSILFKGTAFSDTFTITESGKIQADMYDQSGITWVSFYLNDEFLRKDYTVPYNGYIDLASLTDGTYSLRVTASDTLGNQSEHTYTLETDLGLPGAPIITVPDNNHLTNRLNFVIEGTTDKNTDVTLIHDDVTTQASTSSGPFTRFSIPYTLNEGENRIKAVAANRTGQSQVSEEILITVDTSLPDSPRSLSAEPRPDGEIKLLWQKPLNKVVKGYNIYRLDQNFTDAGQAVPVNSELIETTGYTDLPDSEGTWYYRVIAVDAAGNKSALSEQASAESDSTDPAALSIEYTSHGLVDPDTGRHAPARVDITLEVSEPLITLPFLTITPGGGIPQSVELEQTSDLTYSGFFDILESMPEGTASAVFSARDIAGNQGTLIELGDRILLDTKGPKIIRLETTPATPVKNNSAQPVEMQISFGLSEKIKQGETPQIRLDIANGRDEIFADSITETTPQTGEEQAWQATMTLPADAGAAGSEIIKILYSGSDDLDNISTEIVVENQLQVYQGGLPPLAPPASLSAEAISQGRIELVWTEVADAAGYRIHRQAPGESELTVIDTIDAQTEYIDTTSTDGTHTYAVSTVRRENNDESFSGISETASADSDSIAPDAPVNLVLDMVPQGIRAQWEAPAYTESITYSIYRSNQTDITSIDGMTPLVTGVNQTMIIDPTPSATDYCYVITAVDSSGNQSPPSNHDCLSDLLPVSTIEVIQQDYDPPQLTWSHADNSGRIAGYYLYIGKDTSGYRINEIAMANESFTDHGYTGEERSYTIVTLDTNEALSMGRYITLPELRADLADNTVIKRGIMNRLEYTVKNDSQEPVTNIMLETALEGRNHKSETFGLEPGESKVIPVIVGGYQTLEDYENLTTTIKVTPNPGETAKIIRTTPVEVVSSLMVLEIMNEEFIRGGAGRVWFTLANSGAAEVEIITAERNASQPSTEITYYLMDEDNNVLYSQKFKQGLGNNVITLPNNKTVARIPEGQIFTSQPVDLFVPTNTPDTAYVRLEIDNIYYHLGKDDQVQMGGTRTRRQISLRDTAYYGEITSISPEISKGDQDITITGRAIDRATQTPLADTSLNLVISVRGLERKIAVTTDSEGNFTHIFEPLENEAGIFKVYAVHPDLLDRPDMGSFIINQVDVTPAIIQLSIPKNYEQTISIEVATKEGTALTNLRVEPEGDLPTGVHLVPDQPIPVVEAGITIAVNFKIWADNSAAELSSLQLAVKSDESDTAPWASVLMETQFTESKPVLYFTPDHIETGVAHDDMITETITLENRGYADMGDVTIELVDVNGDPAPDWVRLNTNPDIGTLAIGEPRNVSISFLPSSDVDQGMHVFYLKVISSNYEETDIGLYPTVTSSGIGNVLFKVSDIYTGTFNARNELIRGLEGAKILLQHDLTEDEHTAVSDSLGEVLLEDLPSGSYKCRVTADNHQEYIGRLWIKPGITVAKEAFLEYNLVTVEWEVNEIVIQDKYEIILTATFETDVPAPVVVCDPASINLPDMEQGDVLHGEFTLTNHGLVRADEFQVNVPANDANFQYEILSGIPAALEAKQRITIPYRVTCLQSLDQDEEDQTGAGCYSYTNCIPYRYIYPCANGNVSSGGGTFCYLRYGGTCGGPSAPRVFSVGIGTSRGSSSPGPGTRTLISDEKCLPKPPRVECQTGDCKDTSQGTSTTVGSAINTVYRVFTDKATDLSITVPGGHITAGREYKYGKWIWNNASSIMDGKPDDKKLYSLSEYGPDNVTKDGVPYEKRSTGVYQNETYTIERSDDCGQFLGSPEWGQCMNGQLDGYLAEKYKYRDKHGNWKTYDSLGRLMSYGNRYGTLASLVYDSQEDTHPSGVLDRDSTQVLWIESENGNISRIYDADNREVKYEYQGGNLRKVIDVMGKETLYGYDDKNNLSLKTNANGHDTVITYNNSGHPVKVEDAEGKTHTFEYDYDKNKKEYYVLIKNSAGMIKETWYNNKGETKRVDINGRTVLKITQDGRTHTVKDERGHKTIKTYDIRDNLKKIVYPDNTQVLYEYDLRFNKVRTKQDQLNRITQYEYDDNGNLSKKTEAKGTADERVTTYTYNGFGQVLSSTVHADDNTEEAVTTFTYDDKGNIKTITDGEEKTTHFNEYDIMGNLKLKQDARGKEWRYEYYDNGLLKSVTDPLTHTTAFEYDGMGNRTAMINAEEKRFEYRYDHKNNLIETKDPYNSITLYDYSPDGKLLKQTDPEGKETSYEYDEDRRLHKTIDGNSNTTQMEYNQGGCSSCSGGDSNPDKIIYPTFERTFQYDAVGRKVSETDHFDTETRTTRFEYDLAGNLLKKTDHEEKATHYTYDDLNRLKLVVDSEIGYTNYTYDNRGNLLALKDADANTTKFAYDRNNRLVKETRPLLEETVYTYDDTGNLKSKTDAKNQKATYGYDDAGRLVTIQYFAVSTDTTPVKTVTFTYDRNNNLKTYSDGTTTGTYNYDDLGRKVTETVNFGTFEKTFNYDWYKNSLKKSFTTPEAVTYQYTYNNNNQFQAVDIPDVGSISHNAYRWTRPESTLLPGGASITKSYDSLMRTKSITSKDQGDNTALAYSYTFDRMDNIKTKTTEHGDYTYTYDDLYRLIDSDNPEIPDLSDETFTYDPVGNRLTSSETTEEWGYNDNNELVSHDNTSYTYDNNGNMTTKTVSGVVTSFFYNIEDRLIRVEDNSNTIIAEYGYDPFGRRLWKEVSGTRTYYLYADEGLVAEYDSAGAEIKSYGWKPGSTWGTDPLFMKVGSEYYFYHNDHLGTPQKMTAVNGAVVWSAKYSSFGKAHVDASSVVENNLRFPGQYEDGETGLHYNYFRYYDVEIGRYLRLDPLGISEGVNLFDYVGQNPLIAIDPLGLCKCKEFISKEEGAKIAQEAKTWVGTTYKSPGNIKGSGADCSGSTCKIYNNSGFSYSQRTIGTWEFNEDKTKCKMQKVDTPQIGDVVKLGGHVAIYDPNIGTYSWYKGKKVKNVIWTTRGSNKKPKKYSSAPIEWWGKDPIYYRFCKKPCKK